jgi:hypothetical protein
MFPMPGNPWPHEMIITIEEDSAALLELLWIRQAWDLHPAGRDLPPILAGEFTRPPTSAVQPDRLAAWQAAWSALWRACVDHAGLIRDPALHDRIHLSAVGSPERSKMLDELVGPSWRDEFGNDALTEQYDQWLEARSGARAPSHHRSADEEPERVSLAALIPAWRAGLTKIVTIPCQGSFTRIIGAHTLLVTEETRNNTRTYSDALAAFQ